MEVMSLARKQENKIAVSTLESKAHELLSQLNPGKLAAMVHLLEVMLDDEDEELSEEDHTAIQAGLASLDSGSSVPMETVLADFGLIAAEFDRDAKVVQLKSAENRQPLQLRCQNTFTGPPRLALTSARWTEKQRCEYWKRLADS